ncbi:NAD-dependent deacylase [Flavobacterium ardleyense]|uniref:NAD-dependent deacylase n=1 Tax=Flavobacterium ardleyense TaxID=2038737 RepID=UPI00298BEACA|nr:NAD-dependent deacylase [Flavobacterium ardleyense]
MSKKKHIVFFTGAGISQESGLSTFRGQSGLWDNHKIEEIASPEGFAKNPQLVLDFYNSRNAELQKVMPNEAHLLIAKLEEKYDVTVITQNIDDLHERAGSTKVVHLHGELMKCRSCKDENKFYPYDKAIKIGDLAEDGSQIRPFVVWFGEQVPKMDEAFAITESADLFVIVGSSMVVYPAASLLLSVPFESETVYIDPNPSVDHGINLLVIKEKASVGMQILIEEYLP